MIPAHASQIAVVDVDLDPVRRSSRRHAIESLPGAAVVGDETRSARRNVQETIDALRGKNG